MTAPIYRTTQWRRIRPVILERDGHTCQLQLNGCTIRATHVDHILDWQDGGAPYDPTNLRAACPHCNIAQRNHRVAARARTQRNTQRW